MRSLVERVVVGQVPLPGAFAFTFFERFRCFNLDGVGGFQTFNPCCSVSVACCCVESVDDAEIFLDGGRLNQYLVVRKNRKVVQMASTDDLQLKNNLCSWIPHFRCKKYGFLPLNGA